MSGYGANIKDHVLIDTIISVGDSAAGGSTPVLPHGDASSIQGVSVSDTPPVDDQILVYDVATEKLQYGDFPLIDHSALLGLDADDHPAYLKKAGADFVLFDAKLVPINADLMLIEDSADAGEKKKIEISSLPFIRNSVDFRGVNKITTPTAEAGGIFAEGYIPFGFGVGLVVALKVTALSDTVKATIEFFTDPAYTDRVYLATDKDCYTTPHVDRNPWFVASFDNELAADSLYYNITNGGANNSAFDLEIIALCWA
jgi:hypothetical protein